MDSGERKVDSLAGDNSFLDALRRRRRYLESDVPPEDLNPAEAFTGRRREGSGRYEGVDEVGPVVEYK